MPHLREAAIAACQECHNLCQETLAYHGDEKGGSLSSQHIKRLMATMMPCRWKP